MSLVNAKLVRLLKKDAEGNFITDETVVEAAQEIVRDEVLVSQETIDESTGNYQKTGMLYIPIVTP